MLKEFGAEAELVLIEGLKSDSSSVLRTECLKGLASLGCKSFRVLLFGMLDSNLEVSRLAEILFGGIS
jgi:hypothetical protein